MKFPIAISALLLSASAIADDSAALQTKLDQIAGFKSTFSQTVTDINGKTIQQGSGELALSQPNLFHWHLITPDESLIVADGTDVWIYNPFAEEVSVLSMNEAIEASPMTLLVHRDPATWENYKIDLNNNCFNISPKQDQSTVQQVSVCFKDNILTKLTLDDVQGNKSVFELAAQQALTEIDDKLFKFDVPSSVSIDDQRIKIK